MSVFVCHSFFCFCFLCCLVLILYRCSIDTVSIQYRYCIDTVSRLLAPSATQGELPARRSLRRVNFPLVGRSRSLFALATRLRHDRPDDDSRGSPENPPNLLRTLPGSKLNLNFFHFCNFLYIVSISTKGFRGLGARK